MEKMICIINKPSICSTESHDLSFYKCLKLRTDTVIILKKDRSMKVIVANSSMFKKISLLNT